MTPLDTLAPDQRAVLELVLRQGRSYGELSELLAIPERDVRARADAGLRALAGEPAAGVDSGRIADWLLGQQPDGEAERTRAAVARSDRARDVGRGRRRAARRARRRDARRSRRRRDHEPAARAAAARDGAHAGRGPSAPSPRPRRAAAPRSSRLGGAILIGSWLVVVAAGLLWIFVLRDDEEPAGDRAARGHRDRDGRGRGGRQRHRAPGPAATRRPRA